MRRYISEFRLYFCNRWICCFPSQRLRVWFYRSFMNFSIGRDSWVFMDCTFDAKEGFTMGDNCVINCKCRLDSRGNITIGKHVSISQEVSILTADHNVESAQFEGNTRQVVIEDYVFIGTRAMILPGCTLGKGAIIAAGAIVTKDVAPFTVVAGIPAKVIKSRINTLDYEVSYKRLFQ